MTMVLPAKSVFGLPTTQTTALRCDPAPRVASQRNGRHAAVRVCRGCLCTYRIACQGGCSWVLLDLSRPTGVCSTCAEAVAWVPHLLLDMEPYEWWWDGTDRLLRDVVECT